MNSTATERVAGEQPDDSKQDSEHDRLLLLATDRFCTNQNHDRLTLTQYREAFRALSSHVSPGTLRKAGAKLAVNPFTDRETALYLAFENAKVAAPILRHSRRLTQLDMVQIIEKCSIEHAREIATRPDIGPSVIKRLKRCRDPLVNRACEENPALIKNSREKSADTLFSRIRDQIEAREREQARIDLARQAFLRQEVDTRAEAEAEIATGAERLLKAVNRNLGMAQPKPQTEAKSSGQHAELLSDAEFGRALEKAALARSRQAMTLLLRKKFGISMDAANSVFDDKTGDVLCVAMSAANISPERANRVLLLAFPPIGLSVQNAMRSVRFYDGLNSASSREAVAKWPRDESQLLPSTADARKGVHQPLTADEAARREQHRPLDIAPSALPRRAMPKVATLETG